MPDLSVIIPARCEKWLSRTIADVLEHIEADTEVIAVLDGAWADPGIPQHERVTVVYLPESIGQRAATNLGARISTATYVMKLDAHCAVAQGFDRMLIESAKELGPDVTQIPAQHNLWIFDRICQSCQKREYQGPTDVPCVACGETNWDIEVVWQAKRRRTEFWHFDADLRFQYGAGEYQKSEAAKGEIVDVMTSLGACMFMSRDFYWKLGGFDESLGSWGQFGQEWACKTWLSGGRHVTNKRTWFSHCFRTQGHNFGFPYPMSGIEQEQVRKRSRDLWLNDAWPGQVRPLRWLVDKFWPVPSWTEEQRASLPTDLPGRHGIPSVPLVHERGRQIHSRGLVYYTDNQAPDEIAEAARRSMEQAGMPIVAVSLRPLNWPAAKNIVLPLERGYLSMFKQILAGLEALDTEYVFFCEHDVLYHPSHFSFTPQRDDCYYYNEHAWKVNASTGHALHYWCNQTSGLCANRLLLVEHYRKRVAHVEQHGHSRSNGFEPGTRKLRHGGLDDVDFATWRSDFPNVDVRHSSNLTPSRWRKDQFRNQKYTTGWTEAGEIPGWGQTEGRFAEFIQQIGVCEVAA